MAAAKNKDKKKDQYGEYEIVHSRKVNNIPVISVITSVLNGQTTLTESIGSLLKQTIKEIEVIVVDDGSSDNSWQILLGLQAFDDRIILIRQSNVGLTISLNRALAIARGHYIARHDADDISLPDRLEAQLAVISSGKYDLVTSRALKNGKTVPSRLMLLHVDIRTLTLGNVFIHGSFFCKAEVFKKLKYDENIRYSQDLDFIFRLIRSGYHIGYMLDPLYKLGVSELSISSKFKKDQFDNYKKTATLYGNRFLSKFINLQYNYRTFYSVIRVVVAMGGFFGKTNDIDIIKRRVT